MGILVGIDGTGSAVTPGAGRDRDYDVAFANSFVRRICNSGGPHALYRRGPVALGGGLVDAIQAGLQHITTKRNSGVTGDVLLTGYSRGAAGVVSLASRLNDAHIPVRAIMLFDCVDRHMFIDAETIPGNVANVLHVVRDPASSSRESFGNDGLRYNPATTHYGLPNEQGRAYQFLCTHGGMGGCPWNATGHAPTDIINEGFGAGWWDGATTITYQQDAAVSAQVWQFVRPFLTTHGFIPQAARAGA